MEFQSSPIGYIGGNALQFDRHLGSTAVEEPFNARAIVNV